MSNRNIAIGVGVIILLYFLSRKKSIVDEMVDDAVGGGGGGGGGFPLIPPIVINTGTGTTTGANVLDGIKSSTPDKANVRNPAEDAKPRDVMTDQQAQTNKSSASTTTGTGLEIAQGDVLKSTQSSSTTTSPRVGAIGSSAGTNTAGSSKDPFSPFDGFYEVKSKYAFD